ncbi:MAG: ATP-binding cassette domain-containing protein [Spirochaetes bacterium]|jgi:ABC-2 type transport system ATP-binding protein|nr:ATP-binding cassette domain-containing protein [Spirochaetota bacterium]
MADTAITVDSLVKTYGDIVAVDDISFSVRAGETFCLVGPNGAGKSTTVECVVGLLDVDGGEVRVLGQDPGRARTSLFERCGVQFQDNSFYGRITVHEALHLHARMYEQAYPPNELLDTFHLTHRADTYFKDLSGGEKRKVLMALALVGSPDLVFLDEPTSGLDPHARREMWSTLARFQERGLTVVLTTHNMREAQDHSDTVCIMDHGSIVAMGDPQRLLDERGLGMRVTAPGNGTPVDRDVFAGTEGLEYIDRQGRTLCLYGRGSAFAAAATATMQRENIENFSVRPANLEDLYLMVTGDAYSSTQEKTQHTAHERA